MLANQCARVHLRRVHTEFSDLRIVETGFKVSQMGSLFPLQYALRRLCQINRRPIAIDAWCVNETPMLLQNSGQRACSRASKKLTYNMETHQGSSDSLRPTTSPVCAGCTLNESHGDVDQRQLESQLAGPRINKRTAITRRLYAIDLSNCSQAQ